MGKRSDFERRTHDYYPTPAAAVAPLLPHLLPGTRFIEPCAGDGSLVGHLEAAGHVCAWASDIHPAQEGIKKVDANWLRPRKKEDAVIITNPPWGSEILEPMLEHFLEVAGTTWLLLYSDWLFNRRTARFVQHASRIIAIGRVKWIPGSRHVGKENYAWVKFVEDPAGTLFINERT